MTLPEFPSVLGPTAIKPPVTDELMLLPRLIVPLLPEPSLEICSVPAPSETLLPGDSDAPRKSAVPPETVVLPVYVLAPENCQMPAEPAPAVWPPAAALPPEASEMAPARVPPRLPASDKVSVAPAEKPD